jgi:hypothetical protein
MAEREGHAAKGKGAAVDGDQTSTQARQTYVVRVRWTLAALLAVVAVISAWAGADLDDARAVAVVRLQQAAGSSAPKPAKDPVRVSLSSLHPAAGSAAFDAPVVYRNGCHVRSHPATHPHFCVYGDTSATRTVVLFGDSHAAQWFPAFNAAAKSEHLKLLYITKTACPAASVSVLAGSALYRGCDTWRDNAIALIRKRGHVNLVVLAGSAQTSITKRHTAQLISNATARAKEWRLGVRRTVLALRGVADDIVIMRDTPHMRVTAGSCLQSTGGNNRACQTTYAAATATRFTASERQVARGYSDVGTADFTTAFCTTTRCRPVTSTLVVRWRDRSHMTATFAKLLAPSVRTMFRRALAGRLTN